MQARRGIARLLTVCAVLFGLFLVHGSPASAAERCHGSMPASAPMAADHAAPPMTTAHAPAMHQPGPALPAAGATRMPGALYVATPAHGRIPPAAPGLLAVAAVTTGVGMGIGRLRTLGGSGRRGPPADGRGHLPQACMARTWRAPPRPGWDRHRQPYPDTYAHLTAFREGDAAFAHLHSTVKVTGDDGGPHLSFHAELPTCGTGVCSRSSRPVASSTPPP